MANLIQKREKMNYPIKDPLDRVTSMTSPAGTTQYHYDTITGRLDRITSPEGKEFTYGYNHGQLESLTYPNGISAHYAFDDNGNLTDLDYRKNGTSVRRYQYGYDKNGMRMNMTDNDGVHDYTYDTLYQIIRATHPSIPNPLEQFSYDDVGNRLTDNAHTSYQYNELNQLTEDDSCRYAYDLDGNMTEKIEKNTGDTTHFVYDIENKLVEVRKPGMLAKYTYDALGRRMSKEVNGEAKQFRYDGYDLILEMNANNSINAIYTFGPEIDNPLTMNRSGVNYYYVKDGLGSVTALTDSLGNVKHEYKYGVFGKIVEESGDTIESPFTYTSRELDKETGIYFYRARYYNSQDGRFIQEDSSGIYEGEKNLYPYVSSNPLNWIDPLGLSKTEGITNADDPFFKRLKDAAQKGDRGTIEKIAKEAEKMKDAGKMKPERWKKVLAWIKLAKDGRIVRIGLGLTTLDAYCSQDPVGCVELLEEYGDIPCDKK
jgi:RHS repeat-associated protein